MWLKLRLREMRKLEEKDPIGGERVQEEEEEEEEEGVDLSFSGITSLLVTI